MRILLILIIIGCGVCLEAQNHVVIGQTLWSDKEPDTLVILFSGQSNMVGRDDTSSTITERTSSRIFSINRATGGRVQAAHALDHYDETAGSYGMALDVAYNLLNFIKPHQKILIVPQAKGGSPITFFMKGNGTNYYEDSVTRLNNILSGNNNARLIAFCWHQGESDESNTSLYVSRFDTIMNDFKSEIPRWNNVPVLVGGLSPTWLVGNPTAQGIQDTIESLPTRLPAHNIHFVEAEGAFRMRDNVHFSRNALYTYAGRYANIVKNEVYDTCSPPEKPFIRLHQTSATGGILEWENVFSITALTKINVYIGGTLNSTISDAIDPVNDNSYTISGVNISGVNITVSATNACGEGSQSDAINQTFSSSVPSALHEYLCNETSGTNVNDSGTGNNDGTLSEDASNVTTTLDGTNAFQFDGTQSISLGSAITFDRDDSYTIHVEVEVDTDSKTLLGEQAQSYNYIYFTTSEGLRFYARHDFRKVATTFLSTFRKYTIVAQDGFFRL